MVSIKEKEHKCSITNSYPVCDEKDEIIAILELTDKFKNSNLETIAPLTKYIADQLTLSDTKTNTPAFRREIALTLYDKNPKITETIQMDLQTMSDNTLITLNLLNELKHRISEQREKTFILIASIEQIKDIDEIGKFVLDSNIIAIFIGPDNDEMILHAGRYNIASYIPISKYTQEHLQTKITENFQNITKNPNNRSDVSIFVGTTGGTGTTTISSNLANITAIAHPLKNVLYLDFSTTKAISNIFFGIPAPKKTIIDLLESEDYNIEQMLDIGLYKTKNNLFLIPGIQSHIDSESLNNPESIRKVINLIYALKKHFDYIVIDGGLAQDSELQIAIEEISDQIHIVTELTTIHISILQTYYELMRKAGWRDKVKIVINRENSQSSISLKDAKEILALDKSRDITFDIHLPNEAAVLRECWNYGKMVSDTVPNAEFVKTLKRSPFYADTDLTLQPEKSSKSFFKKLLGSKE